MTRRRLAILLVALMCCGGCGLGVAGQWRMVRALPNRDIFAMSGVEFRGDRTYSATITLDGTTRAEEGTYEFNGFKMLLRPKSGGVRQFDAFLSAGQLELKRGERAVILRKQ